MKELTATEAARRFSEVLDAVEHRREAFVITRGGKTVASIGPVPSATGASLKAVLARHSRDRAWLSELQEMRRSLATEERRWDE